MRRSHFADLIGVSKQQVSKYNPYLVMDGDQVLVGESLAALEGHLDEAKRRKALQVWAETSGARQAATPAAAAAPVERSAKAQKEELELALKRVEYQKQVGDLVYAADIDAAARQAVQELREQASQGHRETASKICAQFGLAPEKALPLQRFLAAQFETLMGKFSANMAVLADAEGLPEAPDEPEATQTAPETAATA